MIEGGGEGGEDVVRLGKKGERSGDNNGASAPTRVNGVLLMLLWRGLL